MGVSSFNKKRGITVNNKGKKASIASSRKFKYGSVAVAFTVIFVAFVILLNAVFSMLSSHNGGFYIDLTGEQVYELSEQTLEVLNALDQKIEIIFCMPQDRVQDSDTHAYVRRLAERYRSISDNISVSYRDVVKEPAYFNQFKSSSADTISSTSVIIHCPQNKRYLVYPIQRFFKLEASTYRVFAYDGENKLTGAILQLASGKTHRAAFITGHGEEKRSSVDTLLREQGYEVNDVDLKTVSEEELASYELLIISNPKYDYTGISSAQEGRVNEIGMLNNYLTRSFGNLMVFISPDTPTLTEFSGFLADDWGVSYTSGDVVSEGSSMALDKSGMYFLGTPNSENSYGRSIHADLTSSGVQATVFANATPLSILFAEKGDKNVSPVYLTSAASSRIHDGAAQSGASMPLMTLSVYTRIIDSEEKRANVLVCGSVDYMNYVSEQAFANGDILKSTFSAMGNESVVTGIRYKVLNDTAITVTQEDFKNYTAVLTAIVPLIIAAIGVIVYIRRKKA